MATSVACYAAVKRDRGCGLNSTQHLHVFIPGYLFEGD